MTEDARIILGLWNEVLESHRMCRIWNSFLRLVVEEVEPDRWSGGPYYEAMMHFRRNPEDFTPESIEKVKAYVRANHPERCAEYEELVPPGARVEFVAE